MPPTSLQDVLAELEGTLETERLALRTLQGAGIDAAAARKVVLEEKLREFGASREAFGPAELRALERVRSATRRNMVLLVHARACVRGALAAARGSVEGGYPAARAPSAAAPLRLDLKR
ncbi:MAG TPA: hypothetical protein VKU41_20000 [Polyangiaceae bacterium]|nr:hypothetical protein [Polyangiaceae bacterium]